MADSTGSVLPGASATLRSQDRSFERSWDTNDQGIFTFDFLPPGTYVVNAFNHAQFVVVQATGGASNNLFGRVNSTRGPRPGSSRFNFVIASEGR